MPRARNYDRILDLKIEKQPGDLPALAFGAEAKRRKYLDLVDPKKKGTKEKYYRVYDEYIRGGVTQAELAVKYKMTRQWVTAVIGWVNNQQEEAGNTLNTEVWKRVSIDKAEEKIALLEKMISTNAGNVPLQLRILGEVRRFMMLKAKMEGVLQHEAAQQAPTFNFIMPNLNRGAGVGVVKGRAEEVVEAPAIEQQG